MDTAERPYKIIATEEAWCTPDLMQHFLRVLDDRSVDDPGFYSLWGFFGGSRSERARTLFERIQDLDARRLADMDALGIDMQLLMLTAPGPQFFEPALGTALSVEANDVLADTVRRHPTRYAGLAALAPQDARAAARELERAVTTLGLKGGIVNSHIRGEYLDDEKFWPLLEAFEALGVPLYIHPSTPSPQMVQPFLSRALDAAIYGFACETGLHVLRMIVAGVFDRYPKLQVVLGHLGEGLPWWRSRIDFMHGGIVRSSRCEGAKPLQRTPGEVLAQNFHYTTSGMCWEPAVRFVQQTMGMDRVLYAMDYPYQVVAEEVAAMQALPLSPDEQKMFFQTNAERVFGLKA